ncbi:MAG: phosphotransferase [Bacteroidales bacterium]|nr:phosphotransferase [Bacteroidales bacterium]
MKPNPAKYLVEQEFQVWKSELPESVIALNSGSGSNRQYFRIESGKRSLIATLNHDIRENEAFFYLDSYFRDKGVRIPEVQFISKDKTIYFQQDLGDVNLLQLVKTDGFTEDILNLYKDSLKMLFQMQFAGRELDYHKCYPRPAFDRQSVLWDLNYFKYYFLKVSGLEFDEQLLENDMQTLATHLAVNSGDQNFMFRDFQARNIQINHQETWFIDFQGGRRGPLLYDVASLLYQASANLPDEHRKYLLDYYYQEISGKIDYPRDRFNQDFQMMVFIRIIQTLGAYGFRGLIEGKEYFKNSIPQALENLQNLMSDFQPDVKIPYFFKTLGRLLEIKNNFE